MVRVGGGRSRRKTTRRSRRKPVTRRRSIERKERRVGGSARRGIRKRYPARREIPRGKGVRERYIETTVKRPKSVTYRRELVLHK